MLEKLQQMVANGKIMPEHLISEDKSLWIEAGKIEELFAPSCTGLQEKVEEDVMVEEDSGKEPLKVSVQDPPHERVPAEAKSDLSQAGGATKLDVSFLSIYWNPVSSLKLLCDKYEDHNIIPKSLLLLFLSYIFFCGAVLLITDFSLDPIYLLKSLFTGIVPSFSFIISISILKMMFKRSGNAGVAFSLFVTGTALLPVSLTSLFCSIIFKFGLLNPVLTVVLLAGFGIYCFTFNVLLLFNACTRIFGINDGGTVFVVSTIILISSALTGFLLM